MAMPLVSPLDRMLFLKAQPYLVGQPADVLVALASYSNDRVFPAGATIREPGRPIDTLHFLADGVVEVAGRSDRQPARRVAAPGVIGLAHHRAGVMDAPRVTAVEETLCREVAVNDLDQIL